MQKNILLMLTIIVVINLFFIPVAYSQTVEKKIFEINCAGCHPNGTNIIRRGKNLQLKALKKNGYDSVDTIINIVTNGKNNMSAFRDRLTEKEINQVANYVLNQAENNWK